MLSQDHFYFNMTKKYIIAFAHIFSDIHVIRTDISGSIIKDITVPISYAGKHKAYYKLIRNEEISNKISTILPRIAFSVTNMTRDIERVTNQTITIPYTTSSGIDEYQYNAVPYNWDFDMTVWSKNLDDLFQIVEQICVFFNPHYIITVDDVADMGIVRNIPVTLNNFSISNETDYAENEERIILGNMNFTLKGFMYPPIHESSIIKTLAMKFVDENGSALAEITEWQNLTGDILTKQRETPNNAEFATWLEPNDLGQGQSTINTTLTED